MITSCKCGARQLLTATGVRYEDEGDRLWRHRSTGCDAFTRSLVEPQPSVEDALHALVVAMKARGMRGLWLDSEGHFSFDPGPAPACTGCDGSGWISGPMHSPYVACQICKRQVT